MHSCFYVMTYVCSYVLCYQAGMGVTGLWCGWLLGLVSSASLFSYKLFRTEMKPALNT